MPLDEPTTTQPTGVPRKLGILREWVRRLRSGAYQQGRQSLKSESESGGTEYCCLGVLGEIYEERHPDQHLYLRDHGFLPDGVWADCVDGAMFTHGDPRNQRTWANLNDSYRLSFNEIADRVERDLIPLHEGN